MSTIDPSIVSQVQNWAQGLLEEKGALPVRDLNQEQRSLVKKVLSGTNRTGTTLKGKNLQDLQKIANSLSEVVSREKAGKGKATGKKVRGVVGGRITKKDVNDAVAIFKSDLKKPDFQVKRAAEQFRQCVKDATKGYNKALTLSKAKKKDPARIKKHTDRFQIELLKAIKLLEKIPEGSEAYKSLPWAEFNAMVEVFRS